MLVSKVDRLLHLVASRGAPAPVKCSAIQSINNIIAFSGGVDSSLVAALVYRVFPTSSAACIGISAALSSLQLQQAREVAASIGVPLWECATAEAQMESYVANQGESCYYCKSTLYAKLEQVAAFVGEEMQHRIVDERDEVFCDGLKPVLYNDTNADDQLDPTRVGKCSLWCQISIDVWCLLDFNLLLLSRASCSFRVRCCESSDRADETGSEGGCQVSGIAKLERCGVAVSEIETAIRSPSHPGELLRTAGFN